MRSRRRYIHLKYSGRRYRRKKRLKNLEVVLINVFAVLAILMMLVYIRGLFKTPYKKVEVPLERLAALNMPYKAVPALKELSNKYAVSFPELTAIYTLENRFFADKIATPTQEELEQNLLVNYHNIKQSYDPKEIDPLVRIFDSIYSDIKYFPIPTGYDADDNITFMYGDSWNSPRVYGGDRAHQGTDISDRENIPGRIPVVSMTGGRVQNMGWNELGGYYVGITTGSGNYYYYAHLAGFEKGLAKDSIIMPGQVIGRMGNTGYSKKEGTTGNFATHLHVGILVNTDITNKEFWINPYPFLRYIEDSRIAHINN